MIIQNWGEGKYRANKKKKYFEQHNLQLNIVKAKRELNWEAKTYNQREH